MSSELATTIEPVEIRHHNGSVQALFRFPNGYGASVVRGAYTYGGSSGLWELAVLRWSEKDYDLTYDTDITQDVIGYLEPAEVDVLLARIQSLNVAGQEPLPTPELTA